MNRRQGGVQVCMSFQKTNKQAKPKQLFAEKKEREFVIFIVHTYIYFFISFLVMTTHDFNISTVGLICLLLLTNRHIKLFMHC